MPDQVRIISGPRDGSWDRFVQELVEERGFGHEREYFGCTTKERAEEVRRKLRTAGRNHLGVSMKVYWKECQGCENGGDDCAYHVFYTAYHPAVARTYKQKQSRRR